MPYSAQKKLTGRSAVAGPVGLGGPRHVGADALLQRLARAARARRRPRRAPAPRAAPRSAAGSGSRRTAPSAEDRRRGRCPAPPGVHDQRRLYAARASGCNGGGTREASASAARSMSSRPGDTGAHDGTTGRDPGCRAARTAHADRARRARSLGRWSSSEGERPDAVLVGEAAELARKPSFCRRAISRSPSIRAGWSSGRPRISRAMRLRICSAKCGVEAPISWRTSSTVTSWSGALRMGLSASLMGCWTAPGCSGPS